ncbi:hypothetical protein GW17_00014080 [Ensete ventricosum]|nr:hypothetical protein GW17_00014080 [Ensete ventricosum]
MLHLQLLHRAHWVPWIQVIILTNRMAPTCTDLLHRTLVLWPTLEEDMVLPTVAAMGIRIFDRLIELMVVNGGTIQIFDTSSLPPSLPPKVPSFPSEATAILGSLLGLLRGGVFPDPGEARGEEGLCST